MVLLGQPVDIYENRSISFHFWQASFVNNQCFHEERRKFPNHTNGSCHYYCPNCNICTECFPSEYTYFPSQSELDGLSISKSADTIEWTSNLCNCCTCCACCPCRRQQKSELNNKESKNDDESEKKATISSKITVLEDKNTEVLENVDIDSQTSTQSLQKHNNSGKSKSVFFDEHVFGAPTHQGEYHMRPILSDMAVKNIFAENESDDKRMSLDTQEDIYDMSPNESGLGTKFSHYVPSDHRIDVRKFSLSKTESVRFTIKDVSKEELMKITKLNSSNEMSKTSETQTEPNNAVYEFTQNRSNETEISGIVPQSNTHEGSVDEALRNFLASCIKTMSDSFIKEKIRKSPSKSSQTDLAYDTGTQSNISVTDNSKTLMLTENPAESISKIQSSTENKCDQGINVDILKKEYSDKSMQSDHDMLESPKVDSETNTNKWDSYTRLVCSKQDAAKTFDTTTDSENNMSNEFVQTEESNTTENEEENEITANYMTAQKFRLFNYCNGSGSNGKTNNKKQYKSSNKTISIVLRDNIGVNKNFNTKKEQDFPSCIKCKPLVHNSLRDYKDKCEQETYYCANKMNNKIDKNNYQYHSTLSKLEESSSNSKSPGNACFCRKCVTGNINTDFTNKYNKEDDRKELKNIYFNFYKTNNNIPKKSNEKASNLKKKNMFKNLTNLMSIPESSCESIFYCLQNNINQNFKYIKNNPFKSEITITISFIIFAIIFQYLTAVMWSDVN